MRFAGVSIVALLACSPCWAASPEAFLDLGTYSGANNQAVIRRVPVQTSTGAVVYKDVTLNFTPTATGGLSVKGAAVKDSPDVTVSTFKAGTYISGNGTKMIVSGPGVTTGGAIIWSAATGAIATGDTCGNIPVNAYWYAGPTSTNPLATRLAAAKITSTVYSYGVSGYPNCFGGSQIFESGSIVGVAQTGGAITFSSFTRDGTTDASTPVGQATFTLSK